MEITIGTGHTSCNPHNNFFFVTRELFNKLSHMGVFSIQPVLVVCVVTNSASALPDPRTSLFLFFTSEA